MRSPLPPVRCEDIESINSTKSELCGRTPCKADAFRTGSENVSCTRPPTELRKSGVYPKPPTLGDCSSRNSFACPRILVLEAPLVRDSPSNKSLFAGILSPFTNRVREVVFTLLSDDGEPKRDVVFCCPLSEYPFTGIGYMIAYLMPLISFASEKPSKTTGLLDLMKEFSGICAHLWLFHLLFSAFCLFPQPVP